MTKPKNLFIKASVTALALALVSPAILASMASAATLSQVTVRFDRMKIGTLSTGTVCARPVTAGTVTNVLVTFPTGYTLGAPASFTVGTTNTAWPTGAVAWPGILAATAVTGQVVTFPSSALTLSTLYCFNWTTPAAVQIKATASGANSGAVETDAAGPTTIESALYSTASIADDQIVVNATVPQAFSFALSGNVDTLPTLSSAAVKSSTTPITVTINTNAPSGWNVWARDSNTGLLSLNASNTIASTTPGTNSTLVTGVEGYNTGVTSASGGGTGTITTALPFVGGATGKGGGLNTVYSSLATSNGTATNHVLSLTNNASVTGSTKPAVDYTDTVTVVGAATF